MSLNNDGKLSFHKNRSIDFEHVSVEKFPNSFIDEVIVSFYFLINNGIVLNKKPGTPGVYMKNSTEVIVS